MGKNIVIYSDGTGQDGAVRLDARLSNIYKLFRATRIGSDTAIDPAQQIAFYDPGLGTDADCHAWGKVWRTISKMWASIAGRGIGTNIADCYEFIINHWQPGDRIFIFGFSRGAYTARCVAQVLSLCGVPTHASNAPGQPFQRFGRTARQVAERAVHRVYEHGAGYERQVYEAERDELARRFRAEFGSDDSSGNPNTSPYFIGVFDTVAALGAAGFKRWGLIGALAVMALFAVAVPSVLISWLTAWTFWKIFVGIGVIAGIAVLIKLRRDSYRYIDNFDGAKRKGHHIRWKAANYDRGLSGHVGYARQAAAIDETRADFPRVEWGKDDVVRKREGNEPEPFVQLEFAGNHSDIGGSYVEAESRLSDIALSWMVGEATSLPDPLIVDQSRLQAFPDPAGVQHNEPESVRQSKLYWVPAWAPKALREGWAEKYRTVNGYPMHPSVFQRFAAGAVDQNGISRSYRPYNLRNDPRFAWGYGKTDPKFPALLTAQAKATYKVGDVEFAVGKASKPLLELLAAGEADSAVAIFPGNPRPDADSQYLDALALKMLAAELGKANLKFVPIARHAPGATADEPGLLAFGIGDAAARRIANSFGAMSVVRIGAGGEAAVADITPQPETRDEPPR